MDQPTKQALVAKLDDQVSKLLEHFDSVRIFCTSHQGESSNTFSITRGGGNFYAQLGHVRDWLVEQDQRTRNDITARDKSNDD